jgi:hypothetical protein
MNQYFEKVVMSLLSAAVLGLSGWVYTTGSRVTAIEVQQTATQQNVQESLQVIRDDVRDLRNALLGPKGAK